MSKENEGEILYVRVGGPPDDWQNVRVFVREKNGDLSPLNYAIEVDVLGCWARVTDIETGKPVKIYGNFVIERGDTYRRSPRRDRDVLVAKRESAYGLADLASGFVEPAFQNGPLIPSTFDLAGGPDETMFSTVALHPDARATICSAGMLEAGDVLALGDALFSSVASAVEGEPDDDDDDDDDDGAPVFNHGKSYVQMCVVEPPLPESGYLPDRAAYVDAIHKALCVDRSATTGFGIDDTLFMVRIEGPLLELNVGEILGAAGVRQFRVESVSTYTGVADLVCEYSIVALPLEDPDPKIVAHEALCEVMRGKMDQELRRAFYGALQASAKREQERKPERAKDYRPPEPLPKADTASEVVDSLGQIIADAMQAAFDGVDL